MVILYEGDRRGLFIRKGAEEARCGAHLNSQVKEPLPDRTLASFIIKSTNRAPNF